MKEIKNYKEQLKSILTKEEMGVFSNDRYSLVDFGYDYVDCGEFKKAFQLFSIGIRLNGNDPDILNGLGISLCELGRLRASVLILEKATELYPDDAVILANLAGVYWELGNYESSLFYYSKSLEADPKLAETHFNLINLYCEAGDLFLAYIACLNFLNIDPDNESAIELRDDILLNLGISIF
ncbi:MAG TPA: hypothetical protein PK544_16300 [Spirochaetota bacterium]|nr:hypothetical protein [Spirochaetota bacterium]HPJ39396.1 hypothetical protein [Spirochaetota bacterium]HPQ55287.1 hypothetical protein [Spirochaetota bacterium]